MKTSILTYCTTVLAAASPILSAKQVPLSAGTAIMSSDQENGVPGHNKAVYALVSKEEQAYVVEALEVAPDIIETDRVTFVYLVGHLPESKKIELGLPDGPLTNATITLGSSADLVDGTQEERRTVTFPFQTRAIGDWEHIVIRDANGDQVDCLPSSGKSAVLVDMRIPSIFRKTGIWHFDVDIRAGDEKNTCLFAAKAITFLKGSHWH